MAAHGLGRQRGAAAAQNDHLAAGNVNAGTAEHVAKARGIGVPGVQLAVLPADQGVDTADIPGGVVNDVAVGHHVPLVGDGDVAAADVCVPQKGRQGLRLQLNEAVVPAAQGGVDGNGPAVAQLPAQQAEYLLVRHGHTSA